MKNVGTRSSSTCKEMVLLTQTFSFNDFHDLQLPTNLFDQAPFFFARHNRSHFPTRVFTYLLKRHTRSLSPRHLFPLEGWLLYSLVSFLYILESIVMMDSPPPPTDHYTDGGTKTTWPSFRVNRILSLFPILRLIIRTSKPSNYIHNRSGGQKSIDILTECKSYI
jgi:hypothetical protein